MNSKKLLRGGRKTPNPWETITKEYDKYGKYAYLFDPNIEATKFYDDSMHLFIFSGSHSRLVDNTKGAIQHFGLLNYPFFGLSSWVAPCAIISGNVEVSVILTLVQA
jgi:hypothetical protein